MRVKLTEKDEEILYFLWRFKIAPTAVLAAKFYGSAQSEAAYRRLLRLSKVNFIQGFTSRNACQFGWTLSRLGMDVISGRLAPLREDGFKTESPVHDLVVTCIQNGDLIFHNPDEIEMITEQELRRIDPEEYHHSIPKSLTHRPDGYWNLKVDGKIKTIALEVELNQKKTSEYWRTCDFYDQQKDIFCILWFVRRKAQIAGLSKVFKIRHPDSAKYHNFVLIRDFEKKGWTAPILEGQDKGKTVRNLLFRVPSETPTLSEIARINDFRKCVYLSKPYPSFRLT